MSREGSGALYGNWCEGGGFVRELVWAVALSRISAVLQL